MNKLCYRVVFNKSRGLLMAVREIARSRGKGDGPASTTSPELASGPLPARLRGMALALLGAFGASFVMAGLAAAQIVADPNAPGRQQATVLNAANGVLQVNVQTPSAAGVSRNVYNRFDVPKTGAVLNNSRAQVQTQLGGWIEGNPWMAQGTARVILNEVNSSNPSQLRGYIEVAGSRAEVVVANAAGIVVDGAGFINVSRATLTTGAPVLNPADGALNGYTVQRGAISIEGGGLDARSVDYTALIARSVQLNAGVWTRQLEVLTGANAVTLATDADGAASTSLAPLAGGGDAPRYGIDTALLGGMYANKITLIGTEAGVGVRNAGSIGAAAGELVVTSEGRLENLGSIAANKALLLKVQGGLANSGSVYGEASVSVQSGAAIENSGTVYATAALSLDAPGAVINSGTISGVAGLQLHAGSLGNSNMISSGGRASLEVLGDADNSHGVIQAQSLALASVTGSLNNQSGKLVQSGAAVLAITADALRNTNGGQVGAAPVAAGNGDSNSGGTGSSTTPPASGTDSGAGTTPDTGTGTNGGNGTGTGTGVTPPAPTPIPDGYIRVAGAINNDAGQIMSGSGIGLALRALDNTGGQLNLSSLNVDGGAFSNRAGQVSVLNDFILRTGAVDNHGGKLLIGRDFDGQSQAFDNGAGVLSAGRSLLLDSGAIGNAGGKIVSAGRSTINAAGAVDNSNGHIQAAGAMTLSATGKLTNQSGALEAIGASGAMQIHAGDIDNSKGSIANAGGGASSIGSDTNLLNTGTIGANGQLAISAQTMQNQAGATVQAGAGLDLAISGRLDNPGAISSGGALTFTQAAASLNNTGRIAAGGDIGIAILRANNDGGLIGTAAGSGADVTISAADIGNRGGKVIADRDLNLAARQDGLDNTSGLLHAGRDGAIGVAKVLLNDAGAIETVAAGSKLAIGAGAIQNLAGSIVNAGRGDTAIRADDSVTSSGTIAGNGKLTLEAGALLNSGDVAGGGQLQLTLRQLLDNSGRITSAGALNIDAAMANVVNSGEIYAGGDMRLVGRYIANSGKIATTEGSGGAIALSAGKLDNSNGSIMADRDALIDVAGDVINSGGGIQAHGALGIVATGKLDNTKGVIETTGPLGKLTVQAESIGNSGGRIANTGSGDADVKAEDRIDNGGLIASNGELSVEAQVLVNTADASVLSGAGMKLALSGQLHNAGVIQSGGTLTFSQTTQTINNTGDIVSGGEMRVAAGLLNNDGGRIATTAGSDANLSIQSANLSNRHGGILSDGAADIAASDVLDNQYGVVQSRRDQTLTVGGMLDNRNGAIETLGAASALAIQAGAIDNTDGRIVNAGRGGAVIGAASDIRNEGLIAANGNLTVNALSLNNFRDGEISSGGHLILGVRDTLNNYGAVSSTGSISSSLATGTLTNAAQIVAGGHIQLAAGVLNNDGGQIATLKQSQADIAISADAVSNQKGLIQADRNLVFTINGALNNAQGMAQAGQNLTAAIGGAFNNTSGSMEAVAADSTLVLQAGSVDNTSGRIVNVGTGASHVGADGLLLNGGLLASNGMLDVTAHTLRNTAAATLSSGGDLKLGVSQELSNLGAINSIGTLDFTQVTAAVHNGGNIISGGKATLTAGVFDNNGGQLATVKGGGSDIALTSQSLSNRGGVILADHNAQFTVAGAADNTGGAIQARQDLQFTGGGALANNAGVIETISADSRLQLRAGAIDNTAGRIVNVGGNATSIAAQGEILNSGLIAGNGTLDLGAASLRNLGGGNVTSGQAMTLGVTQLLNNAGAINSAGTLTFTQTTAAVANSGQMVSAGLATISAGALNNDGGIIATLQNSGSGVAIVSDSMSNHGGRVQASGDAALDVAGALDNAQGVIQAGRDLHIAAGGVLGNNAGVIEAIAAGSALQVRAGAIDNGSGRIVNVGGAATSVQAQGAITSAGTIAGNGVLEIDAQSLQNNAGGLIQSGRQMELSLSQRLENHGAVNSGGTLDFLQTTAQVVNNGSIASAGKASIAAGSLNNDGGQIATLAGSGADIGIDSQSMSNRGGRVLATGHADVGVAGALDNAQGVLQAGLDMQLTAGGALGNVGGVIETLSANSGMNVRARSIDSTGGRIVNVGSGDTRVASDTSLVNSGMIAGNGDLFLSAQTAQNNAGGTLASGHDLDLGVTQQMRNAGTISSAGKLDFTQSGAGFSNSGQMISGDAAVFRAASFSNDGGQIATASGSGAGITVDSDSISNRGGKILANGDASFRSGAALNNSGGTLQAARDLSVEAGGALNNTGGAIEAGGASSTLDIHAASIDSTSGRIVNVGSGDTTIRSDSSLVNSGVIAGNGDLTLKALTLTNNAGGAIGAGGALELAVTQRVDNHAAITSTGALNFKQSAASLVNDGQIVAGGKATIVAGTVVNDNGQIATAKGGAADLTLTANSLSNVKGQILSDGKATLTVGGALNNSQGTIQSIGDLLVHATGALSNDAGAIEAAGASALLTLAAQSIDNGGGRITNIGSGDLSVTSLGAVQNNGVIAGNGNLLIKANTLQNGANGTVASGKNMDLQVTQQLDNQGKVNSAGTLTFNQAAATLNNSGSIVSAGNALITAKQVNNNSGQMGTGVGSEGDLTLQTDQLSNEAGHISTGRDLSVVTHVLQGSGELQGGRDLSLTMDGDYTQGNGTQQFHSNRDLSLTVTGDITNNATFEAVRNLSLSGNNVVNNAGAVIQGQGVAVKAAGDLTNAGEITGEGKVELSSGGTVDNSNAIVGGDLSLTAQNLNNTGAGTLLGATHSMALGVAGTLNNTGGATLYSAGSLAIAGTLGGGSAGVVNNISSTIEAAGDLGMSAGTVNNVRENVSLVKVETVDETKLMVLPSWYNLGDNHNRYETSAANYFPHEVYFVNPDDVLENQTFVAPDGNTYGRAVIRTHANDSAFFGACTGLFCAYGDRHRIDMSDGTRVLYYTSSSSDQANPDQGGPAGSAYQYVDSVTNWINPAPTFSSQYGNCTTSCIRFVTQPDYNDPTTTINREKLKSLAPQAGKLEVSRIAHHVAVEDQIAPGSGPVAQILSGGDMHLSVGQALTNQYGDIMATGSLNIDGGAAISNQGATLYRVHTFDGTWKTEEGAVTAYTAPSLSEVIGTAAGVISGGKGVSISGRSFTNVDVTAGTAGNIRDSVTVLATGNNTATGVSHATGGGANGGSTRGQVGGSGIGNNAAGAGGVGGSGAGNNAALNGQASGSGTANQAAQGTLASGSGAGNNAQTTLDTQGSGLVNNAREAGDVGAGGRSNTAALKGQASGSGASAGALGNINTAGGASQAQGASQVGGNANAVKVAPNGLSTLNPDANGSYVFETRSQFANHGNWVSSDYLLNALNMDPATTQKRLGDGFYEQRMVRDQLIELTGRAPTDGLSDDSRYKELLTSAVSFAEQYDLRPGISLTADQVAHLTSDIVWMETEAVSLPDGSVEQVLVPKVYLAHADGDAVKSSGALVTGNGVVIKTTDSIVNSGGLIDGGNGRTVLVAGQDIVNKGGAISGGEVGLQAGRDVINQSLTVQQDFASVNTSGGYTSLSNQASITASGPLTIIAGRDLADTGGSITAASADISAARDISFNALQTGSTYASQIQGYTQNDSSTTYKVGQVGTTGDLSMTAGQDLKLSGTHVSIGATGNGSLLAGRDISIAAVVDDVKTAQQNDPGSKAYDKQVHDNQTVVGASVAAGGNLVVGAGLAGQGDLAIAGSAVAGGGAVTLSAKDDVSITQVQETHLSDTAHHSESSGTFKKSSDTSADYSNVSAVVGGSVSGDAVTVRSGNDIVVNGSQLTAQNALTLTAGRDLLVSSAEQTDSERHSAEHKQSGFSLDITEGIGYSKSQDNKGSNADTATQVGSVLSGGSVSASSGRDTTIGGSTVVADKDIHIAAGRDLSIVSAENTVDSDASSSSQKSGSIGTRFQAAIGTVKTSNDGSKESVTQVGSQIASLGGDVTLTAGGTYTQTSSAVTAPGGDISIAAKDVLINAAMDVNNGTDHSTYSKTAIGGTISSPVLDAIKSVGNMINAAQSTSDGRMQALAAFNAAASLNSLPTSVAGVTNAGLKVSISLGNSKSESTVVTTSETAVGSTISAGGNVSIVATGAGKDSNLTSIGSDISAGGNVLLKADNDVNLLAATNTASQHSTNNSSGASIGIGFGIGGTSNGFTIDLAVSQARGKADGDDVGYTNSHVGAGDNVTVVSGGDTTLKGGVISADSVVAQIGGDLNIESLQDSSKFDSKQSSSGFNASLCIPPFCYGASTVGGSIGKSNVNGDFLSVLEQSGIKAGDGGFQVSVGGNTDLKGGLLSSSQAAIDQGNNVLMTGSLTSSDLQNKDEHSASGFSLSGSVSGKVGDQTSMPSDLTQAQKDGAKADGKPSASAGFGSASGSQSSTTLSGISGGLVVITDTSKQLATGKDGATVLAGINRDITTETADAGALVKAWDAQQLQKDVDTQIAITQEFSKQAPKAVADFADAQMKALKEQNASAEDIAKWGEGGIYRTALHTVSGALTGGLGGAVGAAVVADSAKLLNDLQVNAVTALVDQGMSMEAAKALAQGLAEATSLGIGAAVGGINGAATALGTDTNNRQLHPTEEMWIRANAKDFAKTKGISENEAIAQLTQQALRDVDYLWRAQLSDGDNADAQAFLSGAGKTFVNDLGEQQKLFTSAGQQLFRPEMFADTANPAFYKAFAQSGVARGLTDGLLKELKDSGIDIKNGALDLGKAIKDNPGLAVDAVWEAVKGWPKGVVDSFKETGTAIGEGAAVALNADLTDKLKAIYGTDVAGAQKALLVIRMVSAVSGAAGTAKTTAGLSEAAAKAVGKKLDEVLEQVAKKALVESGGILDSSGNPLLDMSKLTSNQKGVMGDLFGQNTVEKIVPEGKKLARVPGVGETGLDDLYKVNRPDVDYVVIEYKFVGADSKTGASVLGKTADGVQGSTSWTTGSGRIEKAVGEAQAPAIYKAIDTGRIETWVVTTRPDGTTELQVLDALGKSKPIDTSKIVLPNINLSGAKP